MTSKAELIAQLEASHQAMLRVLDDIDPGAEVYPGWGIKQVLAHLAGWDEATTMSLTSYIQGGTPDVVALAGDDTFNASSVSNRQQLSLEQTFHDWEKERENLIATLSALPDNQLDGEINFPRGGMGNRC